MSFLLSVHLHRKPDCLDEAGQFRTTSALRGDFFGAGRAVFPRVLSPGSGAIIRLLAQLLSKLKIQEDVHQKSREGSDLAFVCALAGVQI